MKYAPSLPTVSVLSAILLTASPVFAQSETPVHPQQPAAANEPAATTSAPSSKPATPRRAAGHATNSTDDYQTALNNRITQMHHSLNITTAQEGAWSAFAQVMHDNANAVAEAYKQRSSTMKTMNASQNLQNYVQIEQQRAQGVQKLSIAFDTLYGQLSDSQKQAADQMFRQYQLTPRMGRATGAPAAKAPAAKTP